MDEKIIDRETEPINYRKRKHDDFEPAAADENRTVKIARMTQNFEIGAPLPPVSTSSLPLPSMSSSPCQTYQEHPQFEVSMASMRSVRSHLSELTSKNESIKAKMEDLLKTVVDELFSHTRVRSIAIGQVGRTDLVPEMREMCLKFLTDKKDYMYQKETELLHVEQLLGGYDSMLELVRAACVELEQAISSRIAFLQLGSDSPLKACLPRMARLAEYTNSYEEHRSNFHATHRSTSSRSENITPRGDFGYFPNLPTEIRLQIWQAALPKPRILTSNARQNQWLGLLSTCHEARVVVKSHYSRVLTPSTFFPQGKIQYLYTNLETDTIIRDLTIRDIPPTYNLFSLESSIFTTTCHHLLVGLSQVKHLALAYDLLHQNGGALFRSVQVCCPQLQTLTVFPAEQLRSSQRCSNQNLKFIDVDSNLIDYTCFRLDNLSNRKVKAKAVRGLGVLATLFHHSMQYKAVFREYIGSYNLDWNPTIKLCLLARWNRRMRGWQMRTLAGLGDRCSRGFEGGDGRTYKGFVEAELVCGEDGEVLSRYDGIERLFGEED